MGIKRFLSESGSVMVQAMVSGAVVMGLGVYMLTQDDHKHKISESNISKNQKNIFIREIGDVLADYKSCAATLNNAGTLENNAELSAIFVADPAGGPGIETFTTGVSTLGAEQLTSLRLLTFQNSATERLSDAVLHVVLSSTKDSSRAGYGGRDIAYTIRLFVVTENNKVKFCVADPVGAFKAAYKSACEEFGGVFGGTTNTSGRCEGMHGEFGVVYRSLRTKLCRDKGNCVHPLAGEICSGYDVAGVRRNNWVIDRFNSDGSKHCACIPRNCPNPANYCAGESLGTDHCYRYCPVGTKSCPSNWSVGPWGPCSGGTKTRSLSCLDYYGVATDFSKCTGPAPATSSSDGCAPVTYNWVESGFGACDVACGPGRKFQSVYCQSSETSSRVDDSMCSGTKPPSAALCAGKNCGYAWDVAAGPCSATTCGAEGTMTITVSCLDQYDRSKVSDDKCTSPKPTLGTKCSKDCSYEWSVGSWGPCSASNCSTGTKKRSVICKNLETNKASFDDTKCTAAKPSDSESCSGDCYVWSEGPYSSCDKTCGDGKQTRTNTCIHQATGNATSISNCTAPEPSRERTCNNGSCGFSWVPGTFGACSVTCGTGSQTRVNTCQNNETKEIVDASNCKTAEPAVTQSCELPACKKNCNLSTYYWGNVSVNGKPYFCRPQFAGSPLVKHGDRVQVESNEAYGITDFHIEGSGWVICNDGAFVPDGTLTCFKSM